MLAAKDIAGAFAWLHGGYPLPAAAREFARIGVPVFPCVPDGKGPLTRRGFQDASTSVRQVEAWWRTWPTANIGMPTGAVSGLVVVDVDVHGPVNGYEAFERAARTGRMDGWAFQVRSPSGGLHVYYPAADAEQRSWQAARAGVDFRGDGGYIIVPPSRRLIDGRRPMYSMLQINSAPATPVDAVGLRAFLDPRPTPTVPRHGSVTGRQGVDVSRLAGWVARRQEGERNHGLFWAACKMAEHRVPAADALDVLTAAAGHAGLSEREAVTTVRSAYRTVHTAPATSGTRSSAGAAGPRRSSPTARATVRGLS